jgi:hypothetical protein
MDEPRHISADDNARIAVLLKEYDALRTEIGGRINNRFAIVGFLVALVTFVGSQTNVLLPWRCILATVGLAVSVVVWWRLGALIKRSATRIADIERKINKLMGEDLLIWESQLARKGLFHRFYRSPSQAPAIEHHGVMDTSATIVKPSTET